MSADGHRGGCHCGRLAFEARLTQPLSAYAPRACDCSFCRKHGAAWLSDADGILTLRVRGEPLRYRQGSGQAEFLACPHCAVLVMVTAQMDGRGYGAINARTLEETAGLVAAQPASPQALAADQKVERWSRLWFADVRIVYVDD
ncbi:MAG TPA: aldehyde-activating protein [Lysobacter sp.]